MRKIGIIVGILLITVGCATQQERAEERAKTKMLVQEAIASKRMHIDVRMMNTLRYGSKVVTSDFYLELRGDTLRSYLPYMGQAFNASMMTPSVGLNFEERILQFSERRIKANKTRFEMDVKTQEDSYHYTIDVYDSGEATIGVRPVNRDPISFEGRVDE